MSDKARHLGVFLMGGTIDSRNNPELDGEVVPLKQSIVARYLQRLKQIFKYLFEIFA